MTSSMDYEPDLLDRIKDSATESVAISKLISIKDFIDNWRAALTYDELTLQRSSCLPYKSVMGSNNCIPEEILEELFIVTNPIESLFDEGMTPLTIVKLEDVPAEVRLQTVKHTREGKGMKSGNYNGYASLASNFLEYNYKQDEHLAHKYADMQHEREKHDSASKCTAGGKATTESLMSIPEAIITANYHRPQSSFGKLDIKRGFPNTVVQILTINTLAQLRDAIKCPKDFEIPGDFSEAPDDVQNSKPAKEIFSAALFFIEGTFYIDRRNIRSKDYSKPIIDWLRKKGLTQDFPVKMMNNVAMLDLKVQLGMPYVYIHQGNCEHVIQFTDIRLMHSDDCQVVSSYPLHLTANQNRFTICNACQTRAVKWMVTNSVLSASDPAHYCDVCYKMLHYDSDGSKICDFKAYQYTDNVFVSQ